MSSPLAKLQQEFFAALVSGEAKGLSSQFRGEPAAAAARFAIHSRNAFANWTGALADAYPVVARLVGRAFFEEAARRYAIDNPSTSGDLHLLGAMFPEFLSGYPPAKSLGYLPDVAHLEWALHESSRADDARPFDFLALGRLSAKAYGAIRFTLHPAVRLLRSDFPVVAIWEANQPGRDGTPDREGEGDWVLVRRHGLEVSARRLDEPAWRFLAAISAGARLEEAASAFGEASRERLGGALQEFVADGVIAGFVARGHGTGADQRGAGFVTSRTTLQAPPSRRQTRKK